MDKIAEVFKEDPTSRYLITGQTDSRGSYAYNSRLSEARAKAVVDELVKRGCPEDMMKWRGTGKKTSIVAPSSGDNARRGDRKETVERIDNMDYWNEIPYSK